MRLLRFAGSVKFSRGRVFRRDLPAFVQGCTPGAIGGSAAPDEDPHREGENTPPSPSHEPDSHTVALTKAAPPGHLELSEGQAGCGQDRGLEGLSPAEAIQGGP